ncbi:hypothetical protein MSIMFB_03453 [Mycobacterium simulans]|uniref:Uncharacterized protein n=1 Tax=Mycobacterium simulans TaxID=627089 RepID=A0A7Z7ILU3_9MYCO|nr:hypothetical protein MSIMFB_03453 [Mycobacterium simulans]
MAADTSSPAAGNSSVVEAAAATLAALIVESMVPSRVATAITNSGATLTNDMSRLQQPAVLLTIQPASCRRTVTVHNIANAALRIAQSCV